MCRKFEFKKTLSLKRSSDVENQSANFKTPNNDISRYLTGSANSNIKVGLAVDGLVSLLIVAGCCA